MRKRIYRISEDKFDDQQPNIEFSAESIEELCYFGEAFDGSIVLKSTNGVSIRGVIYCDSPYVTIAEPQFEGDIISIAYHIDDLHCKLGETLSGEFTVVAVGIEKSIPFKITYVKRPLMCSNGELHSLEEFAALAQSRFSEAVSIFYSESFAEFIKSANKQTRLLYRGFRGAPVSPTNVDEFLVACGLKASMTFELQERTDSYYDVSENIRGEIEILRNTWGFIDIKASCDADFITIEKEHITSDFFLGSVFNMNYYVHKERMHAGTNLARISFDYRGTHKEIIVKATSLPEGYELKSPEHDRDLTYLRLFRDYEQYRLKRMTTGQWTKNTLANLDALQTYGLDENWLLLIKALAYLTNKQRQEALWIIQDLKRSIENKRSAQWAFLLYICTLIEREETYVDRLTEDIEGIFREHADDVRIFWCLLFLRKEYIKNPTAKLRELQRWIAAGHESPILYIEAYYTYVQDPYLISDFDEFTLKVLGWARKHDCITRDMALQMTHVLDTEHTYNPRVLPLLEKCYSIYPDSQLLMSIVTYLLKAPGYEERLFGWYKLAIESNLHIAGVFEAYVSTMPVQSVERMPQLVTMFFRYNNDLPSDKKALLYANIILHKQEDMETYKQYERIIETFAVEQLKLGRLDDNLAICYQQLLEIGVFDKEIARLLSSLIFKKKVAVIYPDMRRVILYQEEFNTPTMATVRDHQAYLSYMGSEGALFLEDMEGRLIADRNGYLLEDVMNPMGYMEKIRALSPQSLPFILQDFIDRDHLEEFTAEDIDSIEQLIHATQISEEYKNNLYPRMIEVFTRHNREEILERHFLNEAKLEVLDAYTLASVIDVLVSRARFEAAYDILHHYNCTMVKLDVAAKICQRMIAEVGDQPDDFLICLTAYLTGKGIIHSDMIYYLVRNFVGPTELMMKIYREAFEKGNDVVEFAERILIQALYRDFMCEGIMEVFDAYMVRKTNRMIVEAFLTFEAHDYLSRGAAIPETVFSYIYSRIGKGLPLNESMRIGLMKYLCSQPQLQDEDVDILDMLLGDAIIRNQYFGFYANCDRRLQIKYHLYDKHFIEFKGEKHRPVVMAYSLNGAPTVEEEMIEMYEGLFVKEFVLFYGDELNYEIYCDDISTEPIVSEHLVNSDTMSDSIDSRYSMMNNLMRLRLYHDKNELAAGMKRYQGLDSVTKDLFTLV